MLLATLLLSVSGDLPQNRAHWRGCHAEPTRTHWVTDDDYPEKALRENQQGVTEFTLQVNVEGCVTDCVVTKSSGWPLLDEATCKLLRKRAAFAPAEDAHGKRITASWSSKFSWMLPGSTPPPSPERRERPVY